MTTNLINYWNLQEQKRANLAREKELNRHQLADEEIRRNANQINLALGQGNLSELTRANKVKETETQRSNKASEAIREYQNTIAGKKLGIESMQARASLQSSQAALTNAATQQANLQELMRSNLANERIKADTLSETSRHNVRSEDLTNFKQISDRNVENAKLSESKRHAQVTEGETRRKNLVDQYLRSLELRNEVEQGGMRIKAQLLSGNLNAVSRLIGGRR